MQQSSVNKGDIVWARVLFPYKWWPALVLTTNSLGVLVSFFDHKTPSRYFFEYEIISLEENFKSIMGHQQNLNDPDGFYAMLDAALKLLGQRTVVSLKCLCQMPVINDWRNRRGKFCGLDLFKPVQAFRGYSSNKQRKAYHHGRKKGYIRNELSASVVRRDSGAIPFLSNMETTTYCRRKRGHFDEVAMHDCSFKIQRLVPFFSIDGASLLRIKTVGKEHVSDASSSLPALVDCFSKLIKLPNFFSNNSVAACPNRARYKEDISDDCFAASTLADSSIKFCNATTFFSSTNTNAFVERDRNGSEVDLRQSFYSGSPVKLKIQCCPSNQAPSILLYAGISNNTKACSSTLKMLETEGSTQNDNENCISCVPDLKIEVQNKDMKQCYDVSSQQTTFESEFSYLTSDTNDLEVDDGSRAAIRWLPDSTFHQHEFQPSNYDAASVKSNRVRVAITNVHVGGELVEKNFHQPVTSHSVFKSEVEQPSRSSATSTGPTSLHIKFNKSFNLPSKKELVKRFSLFGPVDSSKTKIFCYASSAKVVFLQSTDAAAAYQYAKRKKIFFGQPNIRFWLAPFEDKRRGPNCHALQSSSTVGFNLKPCLKKTNPLRKEDRKKLHRKLQSLAGI
ncbi:PWWP domain [Quillaja saponaria]|uniref:PWWP domain n=1 Tax=Quillaja saponaria TaxID=32244 RepID=A0AAD7QJA3_QUISA|nr:PWWP domain [Quillaja saponaria]